MAKIPQYQQTVTVNNLGMLPSVPNVSIAPIAGQALQQAGNTLQQVGDMSARVQYEREHDSAAIWAAKTMSDARLNWVQDLQKRQNQAVGPATDFAKTTLGDYDKYMQDVVANAPDKLSKKFVTEQLIGLRTQIGAQAAEFENKSWVSYQTNQIKETINNNAKTVAMAPELASKEFASTKAVIDSLNVPQDMKYALIEDMRKTMWDAYKNSQIANNATAFKNSLEPTLGKIPEGTVASKVAKYAREAGINPTLALSIIGSESNGDLRAKNSESSAKGLFQFTDDTWVEYGGTKENRNDLDTQIKLGIKYLKDRQNDLRVALGREPNLTDMKLGHMFRGNAARIINSASDTPIENIIGAKTAKANHLEGKTTGEVISKFDKQMAGQLQQYLTREKNTSVPFIQAIATPNEAFQAYHESDHISKQQMAQRSYLLEQSVKDHEAMAFDGKLPQQLLTKDDFLAMSQGNEDKASIEYSKYLGTMELGRDVHQMSIMSPDERASLINSYNPTQEQGYSDAAERREKLIEANKLIDQKLKKDPAAFVTQSSPMIQQKFNNIQAAQTPEAQKQARNDYFSALLAEQQRQGVVVPKLLSKNQEDNIIGQLQNSNGLDLAKNLQGLAQTYGSFWPTVTRQLQQNNLFPNDAVSVLIAPTPQAMERAAALSKVKMNELEGIVEGRGLKKSDVYNAIDTNMKSFYASVPAEQLGDKTNSALRDTIAKSTMDLVSKGVSVNEAAKQSYNMFIGDDRYKYIDNKGGSSTLRIPKQYDADIIKDNTRQFTKQLTDKDIDLSNAQLLKSPWTGKPDVSGYLDRIKSNSIWFTNGDETGAKLYFLGQNNLIYPVFGKDGKQIEKSFTALTMKAK